MSYPTEYAATRGERHWTRRIPERLPRGERRAGAKLTEAAVVEMRRLFAAGGRGATFAALARRYGVDGAVARAAVLRRTWRHVP